MRYHLANNFIGENEEGDNVELWELLDTKTSKPIQLGTYEELLPMVTKLNAEWANE
jgi:hypothetical protein